MEKIEIAILGGGWAGLLSARELLKSYSPDEIVVLEQSSRASSGGLLKSFLHEGFTFDTGGPHILFSKFSDTLDEIRGILGSNYVRLPRMNYVSFQGKMIPYPIENGLYQLPPEARARLGTGIVEAALGLARNPGWIPRTFKEWIYGSFGPAMGAEYLEPYNRKIWKRDLNQLAADWVFTPGRLPLPEIPDISRAMAGLESVGYKEQSTFIYPKTGGIESLFRALLRQIENSGVRVIFSTPARKLISMYKGWEVNGVLQCKRVVSTIPLPTLLGTLRSEAFREGFANRFDYNRVLVVGVAIRGETPAQTAVYVPQPDIPFHRYTWMSYLTAHPPESANLIAEVTIPRDVPVDLESITRSVVRGLRKLGVFSKDSEVLFKQSWLNEYGYPVYRKDLQNLREKVISELEAKGIYSVGRWGSWHYWNTDMVLRAVRGTIGRMDGLQNHGSN